MTRPRVLFAGGGTGGHLYPALALAGAFQALPGGADVFFVGARRGVEARVLPAKGVPHELLPFEPIRRSRVWENWRLGPAMIVGSLGITRIFRRFKPDLVVGTGGYASGPVVAWGVLKGVPTGVQEQNSYPGLTTKWLSRRVRQIHLAFPEARGYLRPGRGTEVFVLGNPIQPPDLTLAKTDARAVFGLGPGPVALVVGGSQGARAINDALLRDLVDTHSIRPGESSRGLQILWATGPAHYERISGEVRKGALDSWVKVLSYIDDMPAALAAADVAISRAGAMALAELCAWGIPSILVPLPSAAANHQHHNARALADAGAAVLIPETELVPGRLWTELTNLVGDDGKRSQLASKARERGHPNAAREIVEKLVTLV